MLRSRALQRYVSELGVTGPTSHPTINAHAMAVLADYDASLAELLQEGATDPGERIYSLTLEDLGKASWSFCPAPERSSRIDGYVSLDLSPHAAYEAATYYLGRLAGPEVIDTVHEKTPLAFADHSSWDRLYADYVRVERTTSAVADARIAVDALAERLQREAAAAFRADWAACSTLSPARRME